MDKNIVRIDNGLYKELVNVNETEQRNESEKQQNYDAQEEFSSMDIDDYEQNEDFDESMEAYDNSGE